MCNVIWVKGQMSRSRGFIKRRPDADLKRAYSVL